MSMTGLHTVWNQICSHRLRLITWQKFYESNLNLQKVLYYGYGGPGDLTGEYLKNYSNDIKYVLTHLAASYCYGGEEVAFVGCTQDGLKRYGVMEYINYLCGQEAPPSAAISLSSTNETAFLEGDVQKTKNITLNGDHRNLYYPFLYRKV